MAGAPLTLQRMMGWLFAPLAWSLGLPWAEATLGGVLLGVVEALGAGYIGEFTDLCRVPGIANLLEERCRADGHFILFGSNYQDVFAFAVLILVLVFRPSGLLGERIEKFEA